MLGQDDLVVAYLFLSKSRTYPKNVNDISLYDTYICELTSAQRFKLFAFTFALLLLLRQTFVTRI